MLPDMSNDHSEDWPRLEKDRFPCSIFDVESGWNIFFPTLRDRLQLREKWQTNDDVIL